jgi:hypothetical protein
LPGYGVAMALAVAAVLGGLRRWGLLWAALACGVAVYLIGMAAGALVTAKIMHYPIWMGLRIS